MCKLLVFTAPSGAGKTTIVRHLLEEFPQLAFSVSATNRNKRPHETDGKDYYFLSTQDFENKIKNNAFVEWEEVYDGQYYGTLKTEIQRLWKAGKHIIFDIDVKGATNIKKNYPDAMVVFVMPPSTDILFKRLRNRKTEDETALKKRMARAAEELTYKNRFDKVLVNDILETAFEEADKITRNFITS